jgi:hypothetical protein
MKFKKIYKFSDNPSGVKRISFENLRPGDLFYSESSGELDMHSDGKFIWLVVSEPESCEPKGNYDLQVEPIA